MPMRTILLAFFLLTSVVASAQITTPVVRANFGVDADLRANYVTGIGVTGAVMTGSGMERLVQVET